MDRTSSGCSRRAVLGTILVFAGVCGCLGLTGLAADRICVTNLNARLPVYPGAAVVREQHNFLTSFGMGETVLQLASEDDPAVVREWYARHTGEIMRERVNDRLFQLTRGEWVVDQAQDGTGSQIILHGVCMQ
jgi:hypothetical protein